MPHSEPVRAGRDLRHLKPPCTVSHGKVRMLKHMHRRLHKRMGVATDIEEASYL
jgi:hypothetical protein